MRLSSAERGPFLPTDAHGQEEVVCVLAHPDKPWCRIVERHGELVAEHEVSRQSGTYRRAGKDWGEIFRRYTARSRVGTGDLVLAWTGDDFEVARYQHCTHGNRHIVESLRGDSFEVDIFEPYRFARNERVLAAVADHTWQTALFVRQERTGFRVKLSDLDESFLVPEIRHINDKTLSTRIWQ
jgi:hypothetical protein